MKGLHVDDGGVGGLPVVLHHGLGADLEVWRKQIGHLRRSRRVLAFDVRGHGRSPRASEYSVAALVTDLEEVTAGLPRFWLVGHSLAGVVLTEFAGRRQERLTGSSTSTRWAIRATRRRRSASISVRTTPG